MNAATRFITKFLCALRRQSRDFAENSKGAMMVEAALIIPFLVVAYMGATEVGRYVNLHQKMERASITLADLVARSTSLTEAQVTDIFNATRTIMLPYPMSPNGRVIISTVRKAPGQAARVTWQRAGAGSFAATSRIGVSGGVATLPAGFTLADDESVVITEMFYNFAPIYSEDVGGALVSRLLYERALFRPRIADSVSLN